MNFSDIRCALCIGHPGHELRVFRWVELAQPVVYVLTDGSGSDRSSRLASTTAILESAGARSGETLYGTFTDRAFYELILNRSTGALIEIADQLAQELFSERIELVAGDMLEGINTTHDVCRMLINVAVERCRRTRGQAIINCAFELAGHAKRPQEGNGTIVVDLDVAAFKRKRASATSGYPELATEVDGLLAKHGESAFRFETLKPVAGAAGLAWTEAESPYYETYGARQIEAGHYEQLITYKDNVQPIAQALWAWATEG